MKKLITILLIFLFVTTVAYAKKKHQQKIIYLKPRCLMGYLYYDWIGRFKYDAIPILDKQGKMIPCKNECEE